MEQYIGLNIIVSENHTDYDTSNRIQILNKELQACLKHIGIRRLKGVQLTRTKFYDIVTFPYLLQSIHLFGQIDQQILVGILKECWNLRSLKLEEPNQYQMLVRGNFIEFMRSIGNLIGRQSVIRLKNLRNLKLHCSTTCTLGYMLVMLSVMEAPNLESLQCCLGPIHANFYPLITGLIVNVIKTAHKTLQDFWLVVESSDAYPEITAKRRFLRKLTLFNEELPDALPKFEETFRKLYWNDEERDEWLKDILGEAGMLTPKLENVRLDIDTMEDFSNNWVHFVKPQNSLKTLELQACCHWSLVADIVKKNAKTLETLGLVMEFHSPMDLEHLLKDCSNLKNLILKNFDFDWMSTEQLEMRRTGHIVNAKFDELFPQMENLALSNLLIRSSDLSRVTNMPKLKDFVISLLEIDAENGDFMDPNNMFGLLYGDFIKLLHRRNLNHLVISKEAIIYYGPLDKRTQDEEQFKSLIEHQMFHTTNILGWQLLGIDEEHIAVAHGDAVSVSDWIFPLLISVVDDTIEADMISLRSLVFDDYDY